MMCQLLNSSSRDDIVGIDELLLRLVGFGLRLLDGIHQLRAHPHTDVLRHVRDEARAYVSLVLIDYIHATDDVGRVALGSTEKRERRRKQEVGDVVSRVEADNLRQYRERRVINHHAVLGVLEVLEVTAREERPYYRLAVKVAHLTMYEVSHCIVHLRRRVAVVRGLLCLKLIHERVVVLEHLGLRPLYFL